MASVESPIYFWAPHFEASLLMLISPFPRLFVYSFFFLFLIFFTYITNSIIRQG